LRTDRAVETYQARHENGYIENAAHGFENREGASSVGDRNDVPIAENSSANHYNRRETGGYSPAWRPITAIRLGDQNGEPETNVDADWQPLINTPNFLRVPFGSCLHQRRGFLIYAAAFLRYR